MYSYSYAYSFHLRNRNKRKTISKLNIFIYKDIHDSKYYAYVKWVKNPIDNTVNVGHYSHKESKVNLEMDKSFRQILTQYVDKEIPKPYLKQAYKQLSDFEADNDKIIFDEENSYAGILKDYENKKISKRVLRYRYKRIEEIQKVDWSV